jgi:hypothetical protein
MSKGILEYGMICFLDIVLKPPGVIERSEALLAYLAMPWHWQGMILVTTGPN